MKERLEVLIGTTMPTRSQEKLLRHLGTFSEALEQAWDVPRALSLPGLAEAMGVVRSGLNQPLGVLESDGMISVRVAHVIGGGSRRRQVYHLTQKGRLWLLENPLFEENNEVENSPKTEQIMFEIIGRNEIILELESLLDNRHTAMLSGLSGIGKTTVAQAMLVRASNKGKSIHSAVANEFSDMRDIVHQWFPDVDPLPYDIDALYSLFDTTAGKGVFVLDDVHLISPRHAPNVTTMLNRLQLDATTILLVGRTPLPFEFDCEYHQLSALDFKDAAELLGDHLEPEHRISVAKALGGHPMALQLYSEGALLPEAGEDIQKFVEQTILQNLEEDDLDALDQYVLFPRPLSTTTIPHQDSIGNLDMHALLRWEHEKMNVEIQHFVRNVRRTMFTPNQLQKLHQKALKHWLLSEDTLDAQILRLYHQLALDDPDFIERIEEQVDHLLPVQGAAIAVILNRAVDQKPKNEMLHYWAGKVALHRHEMKQAETHIDSIKDDSLRHELNYQKALLEGNEAASERLLDQVLAEASDVEAARTLLAAAVKRLEDRLFDEPPAQISSDLHALVKDVKLPKQQEYRSVMMVSLSMIQHAIALFDEHPERAKDIREALASISDENDPFVQLLQLKASLHFHTTGSLDSLTSDAEHVIECQLTQFHKSALRMTYAEFLWSHDAQKAQSVFEKVVQPDHLHSNGVAQQRYAGRWWYLYSKISSENALMAMREASRCYRSAGCHSASRNIVKRMHRLL